jgi:uncharacterized protein YbjT (DUF2867 family)
VSDLRRRRILVTGSSGFIGRALSARLSGTAEVWRLVRTRCDESHTIVATEHLDRIDYARFDAVVHLAYPKDEPDAPVDRYVGPVEEVLRGIGHSNPHCHFVFFTSQSATADTRSAYGAGKFAVEELLRRSALPWTIIRPGLVVDENVPQGLYGQLRAVLRWLPLVPAPAGLRVQPVQLRDVVDLAVMVLHDCARHRHCVIAIALPARSLPMLLRQCAEVMGRTRAVIAVPMSLVTAMLALLPGRPGAKIRERVEGLRRGSLIDPADGAAILGRLLCDFPAPFPAEWECEALCRALFRATPPPRLVARYVQRYPTALSLDRRLFASRRWLLGREFTRRRSEDGAALSERFAYMAHLAEGEPALHPAFYVSSRSWLRGMVGLCSAVFMTLAVVLIAGVRSTGERNHE